jgi:signal transduction histidine kinase
MVVKLRESVAEKDRLSRLAATGELSATLAHEIRNPLNAIQVATAYLKENYKGRLIREFIGIIQNEATRINKLTTSLLNFAKPARPEVEKSDLNKLISELAFLLKEEAKERNIGIDIVTSENVPLFCFDYNQIKQVLLNLIINAFDAIEGRGRILIDTAYTEEHVNVSVKDTGNGIPVKDMKNIFNPFYTTRTRGTGLGLAVSKKIVREHGGDITIDSTPSEGSTFTVILPLRQ